MGLGVLCQYFATSPWDLHPVSSEKSVSERGASASLGTGDIQPDGVRAATAVPLREDSRELRCGEALGPSSVATTRGVEIFVRSTYQGMSPMSHCGVGSARVDGVRQIACQNWAIVTVVSLS
jgi:hypothetical protein